VSPPTLDWMQWYSEATDSLSVMYRDDSCVVFQCLYIILPQVIFSTHSIHSFYPHPPLTLV